MASSQMVVLSTTRGASALRWTMGGGLSTRAYTEQARSASFCVSTRSAELTYVLEGELHLEFGPAKQHLRLCADEACVVSRRTPHRITVPAAARYLVVDLPVAPYAEGEVIPMRSLPRFISKDLEGLWEASRPSWHAATLVHEWLRGLGQEPMKVEAAHNTRRLLEIKDYLERCHVQAISLEGLARHHRLDRFYLSRAFRDNFGASPSAYVQFLRLEHFIWRLMSGARGELTQIAGDAGYGDYSTFCRRIRQLFGRPPSELVERLVVHH